MSLPNTIPAGIRRVEFLVSFNAASRDMTAQRVDAAVNTWGQGIPNMAPAGSVVVQGAPNTVIHNAGDRKVVRSAVHLRLSQPMSGDTLANFIATALIVGGAAANHAVLVGALRRGQSARSNVPHSAVGEAWVRVARPPASASTRTPITMPGTTVALSGVPGGAATGVSSLPASNAPVAPVPLGIADRIVAGPVLSATNTATVGNPQRVFSAGTITEAFTAGDYVAGVATVAVCLAVVYGAYSLFKKAT